MKKIYSLTKLVLLSILFMGISTNVSGQYSGTGTFTKITSLADLTDGYYVIANNDDTYAMNNTYTTFFDRTAISPASGSITNPATTMVWKIETNGSGKTIYNEDQAKYASYTGSSNNVQFVTSVAGNNQRWNITLTDGLFRFANLAVTTRSLQYNTSAPRFACYTNTQKDLTLYKMQAATTDPSITVEDASSTPATAIAFGDVEVNTTKDSEVYTVATANLTEGLTLAISGTDEAYFTLSEDALPATGGEFYIEYAPTAIGDHTATLTISNTANGINETYEITGSAIAPLPVITPTVNDASLGFVDIQGNEITVFFVNCVQYASPAYTVVSGTATVIQNGDEFTVTATTDCTIQINLEAIAPSTVTLNPEGGSLSGETELTQTSCDAAVTLPEAIAPCADWTFAGWSTAAVAETTTAPTLIAAGEYTPTADINLYAVFKKGTTAEVQTTITYQTITGLSNSGYASATWEQDGVGFYVDRAIRNNQSGVYSLQLNNSKLWNTSPITGLKSIAIDYKTGNSTTITVYEGTAVNPMTNSAGTTAGDGSVDIEVGNTYFTISVPGNATYLDGITLTYEGGSFTYNSNPVCETPIIETPDIIGGALNLGTIAPSAVTTETFNVSGANLTAAITLAISGTDAAQFDVNPKSIPLPAPAPVAPRAPAAAVGETPVTVTYTASATNATHTAILTLSSTGAADVVIDLTGETDTALGMSETANDDLVVYTEEGNIVVKTAEVAPAALYSVSGKLISTHTIVDGKVVIPATKGAYLVKVGNKVAKVVL